MKYLFNVHKEIVTICSLAGTKNTLTLHLDIMSLGGCSQQIPPEIFPEVAEVSPTFKTIYEQASAAENYGLDQISGVGYRKALEFLIKDFCIYKMPDDEEKIKSSLLGQVISNHVEDANLKTCANRAAWLGNDETHYVRKWEDKDINDLKTLIELSCVWIKSNVLTEKYLEEME